MKKISVFLTIVLAICLIADPTLAKYELDQPIVRNETIGFDLNGLYFDTGYSCDDYYLVETIEDDLVKYSVYNLENEFQEASVFSLNELSALDLVTHHIVNLTYKKYFDLEEFVGQFVHEVVLNVYSDGSFWQFNSFESSHYRIDGETLGTIKSFSSDVRPFDGGSWPTQRVSTEFLIVVQAEYSEETRELFEGQPIDKELEGLTRYYTRSYRKSYIID